MPHAATEHRLYHQRELPQSGRLVRSPAIYLRSIEVLALVVAAPWITEVTTAAFAETIAPQMVIPVHDGYVKSFFQKMCYDNYDRYFSTTGIKFQRLAGPGDGVEIG